MSKLKPKSNLDKYYKTNQTMETEGNWFQIDENVRFRCKRFGGKNRDAVRKAEIQYRKPFARLIEAGRLSAEKEVAIGVKVFVDACLVDWEGVEWEGKPLEFSFDNAVMLLTEYPDLATELMIHSGSTQNFQD